MYNACHISLFEGTSLSISDSTERYATSHCRRRAGETPGRGPGAEEDQRDSVWYIVSLLSDIALYHVFQGRFGGLTDVQGPIKIL